MRRFCAFLEYEPVRGAGDVRRPWAATKLHTARQRITVAKVFVAIVGRNAQKKAAVGVATRGGKVAGGLHWELGVTNHFPAYEQSTRCLTF